MKLNPLQLQGLTNLQLVTVKIYPHALLYFGSSLYEIVFTLQVSGAID